MKYKKITVLTDHNSSELIASAMFDAGAEGVDIADRQDFIDLIKSNVMWDYVDESLLSAGDEVRVSVIVDANDRSFLPELEARLMDMSRLGGVAYGEISVSLIDAEDWVNEWKKYYTPIVTPKITIVPSWIDYEPSEGEKVMRLDPGMAFGTGGHATTRMCLDMMDAEGREVIDVGCGSGILGIAAALTGAKSVYMCDLDAQAIEFAKRNAAFNGVTAEIEQADLIQGARKADLIFANLTADILIRLSVKLSEHLKPRAEIIISGIIDSRLGEVEDCFLSAGYTIAERAVTDDWRALKLKFIKA